MKTKAAVLRGKNEISIEELTLPQVGHNQVLVEMKYAGVCGTLVSYVDGKRGLDNLPCLLGHEGSGVVVETGSLVKDLLVGDHVCLSWIAKDEKKPFPIRYEAKVGHVNGASVNTLATHVVVSENNCHKVSKDIPFDVLALAGCAVPTATNLCRRIQIKKGDLILLVGLGGIGSVFGWMADHLGAIIVNYDNGTEAKFKKVVDCSGSKDGLLTALKYTDWGGICATISNVEKDGVVSILLNDLVSQCKSLVGVSGSPFNFSALEKDDLEFFRERILKSDYHLEEIETVLKETRSGQAGKLLVRF